MAKIIHVDLTQKIFSESVPDRYFRFIPLPSGCGADLQLSSPSSWLSNNTKTSPDTLLTL